MKTVIATAVLLLVLLTGCEFTPPKPEVIRGPALTETINAVKEEINKADEKLIRAYSLNGAEYFYKIKGLPGAYVPVDDDCACRPDSDFPEGEEPYCPYTKKRPEKTLQDAACLNKIYVEADRIAVTGMRPPLSEVKANFNVNRVGSIGGEFKVLVLTYKNTLKNDMGNQISFSFSPTPPPDAETQHASDSKYHPFPDADPEPSVIVAGLSDLIIESVNSIENADESVSPFCWKSFTVSASLEATGENSLKLFKEWGNGNSVSLDSADNLGVNNKVELIYKMPDFDKKEIVCNEPVK